MFSSDSLCLLCPGADFSNQKWTLPEVLGCDDLDECPCCGHSVDPDTTVFTSNMEVFSSLYKSMTSFKYRLCQNCFSEVGVDGRSLGIIILPPPCEALSEDEKPDYETAGTYDNRPQPGSTRRLPGHYGFTHELLYKWKDHFLVRNGGYHDFWRHIISG